MSERSRFHCVLTLDHEIEGWLLPGVTAALKREQLKGGRHNQSDRQHLSSSIHSRSRPIDCTLSVEHSSVVFEIGILAGADARQVVEEDCGADYAAFNALTVEVSDASGKCV